MMSSTPPTSARKPPPKARDSTASTQGRARRTDQPPDRVPPPAEATGLRKETRLRSPPAQSRHALRPYHEQPERDYHKQDHARRDHPWSSRPSSTPQPISHQESSSKKYWTVCTPMSAGRWRGRRPGSWRQMLAPGGGPRARWSTRTGLNAGAGSPPAPVPGAAWGP